MLHDPTRLSRSGAEPRHSLFPGSRMLDVPSAWPPTLLVVVDTEEEFDWRAPPHPAQRSVRNVQHLPRLQAVFDRHGIVPAYLVDHPVAATPDAVAVLRPWVDAGRCEVGAHLHPWVNPPVEEPVDAWHAFACNLPPDLERRKLAHLTDTIRDAFGLHPRIFKAGAYGISRHTPGFLAALGYRVDSSVVPFTSFRAIGGPDFGAWGGQPFQTAEGIVEIPLTAGFAGRLSQAGRRVYPHLHHPLGAAVHLPGILARLRLLERLRLTPEGHALSDMVRLARAAFARNERVFMLTLHSSSLLPGATEYVATAEARDAFLARLDAFIRFFLGAGGRTRTVSSLAADLLAAHPA